MMKLRSALLLTLLFWLPPAVKADSVDSLSWSWTVSGSGFDGSGTLVTGPLRADPSLAYAYNTDYLALNMTGQLNGQNVSLNGGYILGGGDTSALTTFYFDPWKGLNFQTSNAQLWRLVHPDLPVPSGYEILLYSYSSDLWSPVDVTITPLPEPSVWMLTCVGLVGMLLIAVMKRHVIAS